MVIHIYIHARQTVTAIMIFINVLTMVPIRRIGFAPVTVEVVPVSRTVTAVQTFVAMAFAPQLMARRAVFMVVTVHLRIRINVHPTTFAKNLVNLDTVTSYTLINRIN